MSSFEMLGKDPRNTVIKVIGVGGGGGNAVQYMVENGVDGIEFIAANTDHQALAMNKAHVLLQLGESGLGAGADPAVGAKAAEDSAERIRDAVSGAHLLFITAGMGGGTGTGAAPVIARIAKEEGILTVGVVTKPFFYEGTPRMARAEQGIEALKKHVDSLIVILNDKLEDEFGEDATMDDCFNAVNDVLLKACNGIAEIIHTPGLINVDFNDLKTVMREHGTALMGYAVASGPDRAEKAAEQAVSSPLLEGTDLNGARGLLVYVTASSSLKASEPRKIMSILRNFVSPRASSSSMYFLTAGLMPISAGLQGWCRIPPRRWSRPEWTAPPSTATPSHRLPTADRAPCGSQKNAPLRCLCNAGEFFESALVLGNATGATSSAGF